MKKIILDVDTGIDDALAIAYALNSKEVEVIAITTCFGNTSVEQATINTLKVLTVFGREDIPVIPGANKPLFRGHLKEKATFIHGEDGLANNSLPLPKNKPLNKHAVQYLTEIFRKYPNEVTYIPVGSMTNLALAIMKDPEIVNLVGEVIYMGGAIHHPGNVTPVAEANIYTDPEAVEYVLQSGIPLTLVGLDVTMQTLLTRDTVEEWKKVDSETNKFLVDIVDYYMEAYHGFYTDIQGCALHDPLAVGVAIDSSFVTRVPMYVQVDTEGDLSIGRTIADLREDSDKKPNTNVCIDVDVNRFVTHFCNNIGVTYHL